jgi:hypothetical protein
MWTKYFKVVKIRRGRVITPRHGEIDFSRDNIPVEICQQLYEEDFPYLEITEEGKKELYGINPGNIEPISIFTPDGKIDEGKLDEVATLLDDALGEYDQVFEPLPAAEENPEELIPIAIGTIPIKRKYSKKKSSE